MFNRTFSINRQAIIYSVLILHGTTNRHIVIPISPVRWQTLLQSLYPLRYEHKVKVLPYPHHFPCFSTPSICIFNKKIGSKAGIYQVP